MFTKRVLFYAGVPLVVLTYVLFQANAHSNGQGISGLTNKSGGTTGCYCHCSSSSSGTSVSITTSTTTFYTGQSYTFTVTVSNSSESGAGVEVAVKNGSLSVISGDGLQLISSELTHTTPKTSLPASWSFTYTAPSTAQYDTLFAVGNAVNLDGTNGGGNCTDNWNFAPKFVVNVQNPPVTKAIALSRTSIPLGSIRVGNVKRDSFQILSTSTSAITVNTALNSGAVFSRYPTGSNRSINAGTSELDSAEFRPTSRGFVTDSIIITSNVDATTDQRKAIYVSGTGIAGVYNTSMTALAFGNLRINHTAQMSFVYSNTGDDTLFMQNASISGSGFSIVRQPNHLNLPPGANDTVIIQFAPSAKTSYSGSLTPNATGQTLSSVSLTGTGVAPTISFLSPDNLGGIRVGQSLQNSLTIQNTGSDTLHISSASITGGATTKFSVVTGPANIVLPGGQTSAMFGYQPTAEKVDTITYTIHSDDASDSVATAIILGQGTEPHISVDQVDTVDFGAVKINGNGTSRTISILNTGSDVLNVSSVVVAPLPFTLISKSSSIFAGGSGQVVVQFAPTATGNFTGSVLISSDDPAKSSVTVYVKGSGINSALSVPSVVDFQGVAVSSERDTIIKFVNAGSAAVNVLKYTLTTSDPALGITDTTQHSIAANDSIAVGLKFAPTSAQSYSGTLTVLTDDNNAPTRTIQLLGQGLKTSLSLSSSTLTFGSIDTLTTKTDSVTVCNTGNVPVEILSDALSGTGASAYTVTPSLTVADTIAAGGCFTFKVTFDPAHSTTYSGSLAVTTSVGSPLQISLSGTGNPPKNTGVVAPSAFTDWSLKLNPNPLTDRANLSLTVPQTLRASIVIFDEVGRTVGIPYDGMLDPGTHVLPLDATQLGTGTYFVRVLTGGQQVGELRMIIQR
jgi:hypothetical protein